jgi:hypothetical protein
MICAVLLVGVILALPVSASPGFRVARNVPVSNEPHFQREPAIAVNPADDRNLIVAVNDGRLSLPACRFAPVVFDSCVWVGVYASRDGGKSWQANLIPGYPGGPRGVLSDFNLGYDPVVGFDRQGTAYAGGIFANVDRSCSQLFCLPNLDTSVAIARSDDGGRTWNDPVIVNRGNPTIVNDHPTLAVDASEESEEQSGTDQSAEGDLSNHGNVYVTWTSTNELGETINLLATSRDRGTTWSTVRVGSAHDSGDPSSFVFDPMPVVGPAGELFVIWDEDFFDASGATTQEIVWMAVSQDGGRTFGDPRLVEDGIVPFALRNFSIPILAIDTSQGAHRGRLYLTWTDGRSGNGDILLKWSEDRGVTWSSTRRVNDDVGAAEQYNQWISIAPNGRVDIAFYDRRDDPNNVLTTRYYAGSTDGGLTFTNVRVSDASWDPATYPLGLFSDDYDQIASTARAAHLVWADSRNAGPDGVNTDIYKATVFPKGGTDS